MQKNNLKSTENTIGQFGCLVFVCFMSTMISFSLLGNANAEAGDEYALKAAFVLNFAKFTNWPEGSFANDDTVNLCVLGDHPPESSFQNIEGKIIGNRKIHVRFVQTLEDIAECNILFVAGQRDELALAQLFAAVRNRPVLTIGEMDSFAYHGGVINLVDKDGKLRFEISPANAVQQGGITLSSRLLQLAIIVDGK